jgi:membrane fusion protein (multidrug efflux system)
LEPATKTMLAEIEVPNPDGAIRPGAYATVQLEVERKPGALLVPAQALLTEKAGTSVFKPVEGKARKFPVRAGFNDGVNVEILEGVKPGERVLLAGPQVLTDGMAVLAMESK